MNWPENQMNVLQEPLEPCSLSPVTGFTRNGCCETGPQDIGSHTVCVQVTEQFLEFSRSRGNDLSTPRPEFGFPGLKEGDRWCLCAPRYAEALEVGTAPRVFLRSTHERALEFVSLADLMGYALDLS
ncbi:MAG: DUF2237 domain-containing protein [Gammaproteobacteria bacterium]|nr:DUF2237 domain-containing protein [Gammaproteobacteria bacterium]MYD76925.1 DUF2237 domain-containing protein [Gammaproteobacteria bacterium]MYJ52185.1 DUF2237 domain-containing protein [Gammaproteobacteria bacterium]